MNTFEQLDLRPVQREIVERTHAAWAAGRSAIFCMGLRSGKSTILGRLANEHDGPVVAIGETHNAIERNLRDAVGGVTLHRVEFVGARDMAERIARREARERELGRDLDEPLLTPDTLVLVDEPFHIYRGEQLVNRLAYHTARLAAIGSACDHRVPWRSWEAIPRWATWEANPDVRPEDLDDEYLQNPTAARRDYGSYKDRPRGIDHAIDAPVWGYCTNMSTAPRTGRCVLLRRGEAFVPYVGHWTNDHGWVVHATRMAPEHAPTAWCHLPAVVHA